MPKSFQSKEWYRCYRAVDEYSGVKVSCSWCLGWKYKRTSRLFRALIQTDSFTYFPIFINIVFVNNICSSLVCYYTWHTVNHYSKVPSLEKMEYFNLSENCFKRKFPWQTGVKSILKCWIIQLTLICNFFSTTFCEWKCFAAGTFNSPLRYVLTDVPCYLSHVFLFSQRIYVLIRYFFRVHCKV